MSHQVQRGRPFDANGNLTRKKIIDSARECFAKQGYGNATNKMIAESAGVTASAIYNYFPAKKDIFLAVFREGEMYMTEKYEHAIQAISSPLAAICKLLDCNLEIYRERPDLPPFFGHIQSEISRYPELVEAMANRESKISPIFSRLVLQAQEEGEFNHRLPAENIESMILSAILGLSLFGLHTDAESHYRNIEAFKLLLQGDLN